MVICMLLKELHYYDSMSSDGRRYLKTALKWLSDEHMDKKQIPLDTSEWRCFHQETIVPQQNNGFDCGMFVIMCARAIAYNQPLHSYHQEDMPRYRLMIGRHILRQSLLDSNNQSVPYMFDLPPSITTTPAPQPVQRRSNHSNFPNTTKSTNSTGTLAQSRMDYCHGSGSSLQRPHHAIFPTKHSSLIANTLLPTNTTSEKHESEDSEDSEDSEEIIMDTHKPTTSAQKEHLHQNTIDSEDSDDSCVANNRATFDQTICKSETTFHRDHNNNKSDHRIRASKLTTKKLADSFTKCNTENYAIMNNSGDNSSENASIDNDVDGTHGFLFLNSDSDDVEDSHSLSSKHIQQKKKNHALNKKRRYWKKKLATNEYIGLLENQDDNLLQFPDGAQYRLK
jgi:hypothetical protein